MYRIAVIIIAFGEPYIDFKLDILRNNIEKLRALYSKMDIELNLYSDDFDIEQEIRYIDPKIKINKSKGHLLQLLFKFNDPKKYQKYDYVILIMDDLEILNVDFNKLIKQQKKYNLDLISPRVLNSHMTMVKHLGGLRTSIQVEFFFYFMTPKGYKKYFDFMDKNHITMWGYDWTVNTGAGLRCAINYNMVCMHHIRSSVGKFINETGYKELDELEKRVGFKLFEQVNDMILLE